MRIPRTSGCRTLLATLLCTLSLAACGPAPEAEPTDNTPMGAEKQPVVYGTDNRTDVYAHANATLRARAQQSTVALMNPSDFNATNPNNVTFNASTLRSAYNLCTSERFYRSAAGAMQTVTTADIFSCQAIVARQQATVGGRNLDFAIVRLDRPATPRFTPAPIRAGNAALAVGTNVTVIGSGSGIPFKIDSGGSVRDARSGTLDYFVATTDTFGGNSGSGVYENSGYTVAGILVRGETDYKTSGSCSVVNTCTEAGCRGEDITYVRPAIDDFCGVATSTRLCAGYPPPPTPVTFTFTATNTNSANQNTVNRNVTLAAGQTLKFGTCTVPGSSGTGDTYLRLYNGTTQVTSNDDACGTLSYASFTATAAGTYQIRAGCYSSGSCSGTVSYTVQ
ncbi:MAG: serine protease [Myxococcaceae bacterium]|nr:MAG: serine protease [Myxococcaceae bacterium]